MIPAIRKQTAIFRNPHQVPKYLVNGVGFYIGYYSALEFLHSLITQPSLREQIVVNKQVFRF